MSAAEDMEEQDRALLVHFQGNFTMRPFRPAETRRWVIAARRDARDMAALARVGREFARAAEAARCRFVAWNTVYRRVRALRREQDTARRRTMRRRRLTFGRGRA